MTSEHLRRAWARAQLLDGRGRSGVAGVAGVAAAVGGLQAQDWTAAALAVRARGGARTRAEVDDALTRGDVVVTWTLRGTRHLHARADAAWMVRLLGPVFNRPNGRRARQLGIDAPVGDRAVAALREAVADGPLDRDQVKTLLAPLGVDPSGQAPIHLIARAAMEGVLTVLPGRPERYAAVAPKAAAEPTADPAVELARRHLAAFGPATVDDFRSWSGLPSATARKAWAALHDEVVAVAGGRSVLADPPRPARAAGRRPLAPRLLGAFDTLLLGRADRSLLVAPEHARKVNAGGGILKPTVLVDGAVVGTWSASRGRIDILSFEGDLDADLGSEVAVVGAFLKP